MVYSIIEKKIVIARLRQGNEALHEEVKKLYRERQLFSYIEKDMIQSIEKHLDKLFMHLEEINGDPPRENEKSEGCNSCYGGQENIVESL